MLSFATGKDTLGIWYNAQGGSLRGFFGKQLYQSVLIFSRKIFVYEPTDCLSPYHTNRALGMGKDNQLKNINAEIYIEGNVWLWNNEFYL